MLSLDGQPSRSIGSQLLLKPGRSMLRPYACLLLDTQFTFTYNNDTHVT